MRRSRSPTRHHDASRSPVDRRPRDRDNQYLSDQEGYVFYLYISIKVPVQLWKYFLSKINEKSPHIYNSSNQVPIQILRQSFYPPLCGAFPPYWTLTVTVFAANFSNIFLCCLSSTWGIATARRGLTYCLKLLRIGQEATGSH